MDWRQRFRRIGAPPSLAFSEDRRQALLQSRFDLLPMRYNDLVASVVDVGANMGQWSKAVREFIRIQQHILIEPNPGCAATLAGLSRSSDGMVVHQCALGLECGESSLNVTRGSTLASLLPVREQQRDWHGEFADVVETPRVSVTTLDDLLSDFERVSLLKLDVQGFEKQVLEGGTSVLQRTDIILLELDFESHYDGDSPYYDIARLIEGELGFKFWDMSPPERRRDGRALWLDACFVRA